MREPGTQPGQRVWRRVDTYPGPGMQTIRERMEARVALKFWGLDIWVNAGTVHRKGKVGRDRAFIALFRGGQ